MKQRIRISGFTLVELLVALSIIIILTVITVPAVEPMISASGVDGAARSLQAALQHARYSAAAEGTESVCWLAQGSVFESGLISDSGVTIEGTFESDIDIIVDDPDDSPQKRFETLTGTSWSTTAYKMEPDVVPYGSTSVQTKEAGSVSAKWTFALPEGSGKLKLEAWYMSDSPDSRSDRVYYTIDTGSGATRTVGPISQKPYGSGWIDLGAFHFVGGSARSVVLSVSGNTYGKYIVADALRVTKVVPSCERDEFIDHTKTWVDDVWNQYYVTWISSTADSAHGQQVVDVKDGSKIVAASDWDPCPEIGARYLITKGAQSVSPHSVMSVGSGTATSLQWNRLPEGVRICPYRINDNGSESDVPALPVLFRSTGRPTFSAPHLTVKVFAVNEDNSPKPDMVRYLRIFRNTGRVLVESDLSDLPD
jgi:Tfp pilus assembly protein FimT